MPETPAEDELRATAAEVAALAKLLGPPPPDAELKPLANHIVGLAPAPPPAPEPPNKKPRCVAAAAPAGITTEYEETANKLGFSCPELSAHQLDRLLHKLHLPVYNFNEVRHYLNSIAPAGKRLCWRTLRSNDWNFMSLGQPTEVFGVDNYHVWGGAYDKPVPLHVLKRVAALESEDRNGLGFFVSDFSDRKEPRYFGDPFLAVLTRDRWSTMRIIAAWDEPGFDGRPEVV
jgi:hypothetical protein